MITTTIYLVRHAQSDIRVREDAIRPLTEQGFADTKKVTKALQNRGIHRIFSSPYIRCMDTVKDLADVLQLPVEPHDDFRERCVGGWAEDFRLFSKQQWEDFHYKLEEGESLFEVQQRNIRALLKVLEENHGEVVAIGTHGTAMSTIINYFDSTYGYESFWSIIDKMPYILELKFDGDRLLSRAEVEHL